MKIHTTNYKNAFIEVAEDCPAVEGEMPPVKGEAKTVANFQFEMLSKNPYAFTSDEVLFHIYAIKNDLVESELKTEREKFFSRGQACLRTSPLAKRYGWGIHHDNEGRIALFGRETDQYEKLQKDNNLQVVKAMRSSRK